MLHVAFWESKRQQSWAFWVEHVAFWESKRQQSWAFWVEHLGGAQVSGSVGLYPFKVARLNLSRRYPSFARDMCPACRYDNTNNNKRNANNNRLLKLLLLLLHMSRYPNFARDMWCCMPWCWVSSEHVYVYMCIDVYMCIYIYI